MNSMCYKESEENSTFKRLVQSESMIGNVCFDSITHQLTGYCGKASQSAVKRSIRKFSEKAEVRTVPDDQKMVSSEAKQEIIKVSREKEVELVLSLRRII